MKSTFLKHVLLAATGFSASFGIHAETFWTACDGCGILARQQAASSFLVPNSLHHVYVVDSVNHEISKFEILSEIEPGHYNVEVNMVDVEPEIAQASTQIWQAIDSMAADDIEIPEGITNCEDDVSSYIISLNCRGHIREHVNSEYFGSAGALSSLASLLGVGGQTLNALFGMDRSLILTLRFPDGSRVRVNVTLSVNANGFLEIHSLELLDAQSADGTFLPINQAQAAQYSANGIGGDAFGDLMTVWRAWDIRSVTLCNREYQSRTTCTVNGNGQITCTVEGRIVCD